MWIYCHDRKTIYPGEEIGSHGAALLWPLETTIAIRSGERCRALRKDKSYPGNFSEGYQKIRFCIRVLYSYFVACNAWFVSVLFVVRRFQTQRGDVGVEAV